MSGGGLTIIVVNEMKLYNYFTLFKNKNKILIALIFFFFFEIMLN